MTHQSRAAIVSYVSSPHQGYLNFFRQYEGGTLYVLGRELISEFSSLVRNLPGNSPEDLQAMITALGIFSEVLVLEKEMIPGLHEYPELIMPDEDVSHALAEKYFASTTIRFDGSWRLRWDRQAVLQKRPSESQETVSFGQLDREIMKTGFDAAEKSSDWWRQVGAVLARDGKILLVAFNKHQPSEQSPYLYGDPRSNFEPGQCIDMSTALHAEVAIIAAAASQGISTKGCDLYVTTFPCPPCAYACAKADLKRLLYAEGYSLLAGADAFDPLKTQLVRVDMTPPSSA